MPKTRKRLLVIDIYSLFAGDTDTDDTSSKKSKDSNSNDAPATSDSNTTATTTPTTTTTTTTKDNKDVTTSSTNNTSTSLSSTSTREELDDRQKHQLKHRELFLSRQVDTLPATHIRGKCAVTLLNETESLLSYLNKEVSGCCSAMCAFKKLKRMNACQDESVTGADADIFSEGCPSIQDGLPNYF